MKVILHRIRGDLRDIVADPDPRHRQIAAGFVWVSLFMLFGKLAGAAKEMAVAWRYGVCADVDTYVFVLNLICWPVSVWFSVISVVVVPLIVRAKTEQPAELQRFNAEMFGMTLVFGLVAGGLAYAIMPMILRAGTTKLTGMALREAISMARHFAVLLPLGAVISFFSVWMLALGRHRNTLFEAIPALLILAALLLPNNLLANPLVWGTLAGFVLHVLALGLPLHRRDELRMPGLAFASPIWRRFRDNIGFMTIGQILMSVGGVVDQFFAARLEAGSISTLGYANRIMALIIGMGAAAISRATLPVFAAPLPPDQTGQPATKLAERWAGVMFLVGSIGMIALWSVSPHLVRLLFERGAFTSSHTVRVAEILRYSALQIPMCYACLTLTSLMAASNRYNVLMLSGLVGLLVKIAALVLLVPTLGLKGLVLSSACVYSANALLFWIASRRGGL
jgi:peptidoglycan biosynthesis protein MviN/MurJ (putative lipid II flippase)